MFKYALSTMGGIIIQEIKISIKINKYKVGDKLFIKNKYKVYISF